jgi:ABC-type oligopeptide transport system substrate-binding subunit
MKKSKLIVSCLAALTLACTVVPCSTHAYANTTTQKPTVISNSEESIMPLSDDIRYVYKITEDGKKYKRLYNYSKGMWIGDWIRVN